MKLIVFTLSLCFSSNIIFAQDEAEIVPPVKNQDLVLDLYVGYPNWGNYNFETYITEISTSRPSTVQGIVPIGLKGEFMLSDEISFTMDGSYSEWGGEWDYEQNTVDGNNDPVINTYENSFKATRFMFQIGANYHLPDLGRDDLDMYMGFAIGTNNIETSGEVEQPGFDARSQMYFLSNGFFATSATLAQTPISARLRLGGRYFFNENIGLNVEVGTGVRTILFGLAYKL